MSDISQIAARRVQTSRNFNLPPGKVKMVETVVNKTSGRGGNANAVTQVTWYEKKSGEQNFTLVESVKRSSTRKGQYNFNVPATRAQSIEAARAASAHGDYILGRARSNYDGTTTAIEALNELFEGIGFEIQTAGTPV